jgi:hypothetical protein
METDSLSENTNLSENANFFSRKSYPLSTIFKHESVARLSKEYNRNPVHTD